MTTYAQRALDEVTEELARVDPDGTPYVLRVLYALLVLTKGTEATMRDVHDVWSLWRTKSTPEHPNLMPFAELAPEVQELDRPYMEAVHRAAVALGICAHSTWMRNEDRTRVCRHCGKVLGKSGALLDVFGKSGRGAGVSDVG